ncbi:MAG: thioredoxin family protein [Candidatus Reddybacter sp.]
MNKSLGVKLDRKLPSLKLCRLVFVVCIQLFITSGISIAAEVNIPVASDFEQDGQIARSRNAAILLYFSAPDCRYCMKLEEAVLKPMLRSGDYDKQVLLRKVDWRSPATVVGFSGQRISLHSLAEHYAVKVAPTLVFIDPRGREVAPRILGFQSADFFWYYLDQNIKQSRIEVGRGIRQ